MCIISLRLKLLYYFRTVHLILHKASEVSSDSKTWSFGWFGQRGEASSRLAGKPPAPGTEKLFYSLLVSLDPQTPISHQTGDRYESDAPQDQLFSFLLIYRLGCCLRDVVPSSTKGASYCNSWLFVPPMCGNFKIIVLEFKKIMRETVGTGGVF